MEQPQTLVPAVPVVVLPTSYKRSDRYSMIILEVHFCVVPARPAERAPDDERSDRKNEIANKQQKDRNCEKCVGRQIKGLKEHRATDKANRQPLRV